jgi:hypothetical protein
MVPETLVAVSRPWFVKVRVYVIVPPGATVGEALPVSARSYWYSGAPMSTFGPTVRAPPR